MTWSLYARKFSSFSRICRTRLSLKITCYSYILKVKSEVPYRELILQNKKEHLLGGKYKCGVKTF